MPEADSAVEQLSRELSDEQLIEAADHSTGADAAGAETTGIEAAGAKRAYPPALYVDTETPTSELLRRTTFFAVAFNPTGDDDSEDDILMPLVTNVGQPTDSGEAPAQLPAWLVGEPGQQPLEEISSEDVDDLPEPAAEAFAEPANDPAEQPMRTSAPAEQPLLASVLAAHPASTERPLPDGVQPAAHSPARAIKLGDPLAPIYALSEEEKIALFS
jgi:hypothetical protein